ncbi:MAG: alpha/beta hydrolase [Pseudomonadota bacterium]
MIQKVLPAICLTWVLAACESQRSEDTSSLSSSAADDAPAASVGPTEGKTFAPDGVEIHYRVMGSKRQTSDPTLVFVHGWSCNTAFWREQLSVFAENYRVVALDLGGHGQSGTDRGVWTIAGLAQDVQAVADELKLRKVVLIGHSMGGPVSLAAAARMPGRVDGVIGVDTLHNADIEYPVEQVGQMMAAFQADFGGSMKGMFEGMGGASLTPELRDWIVAEAQQTDPEVAVALFADFARISLPDMLQNANTPIRVINAGPGPMTPVTEVELNRRYADYEAVLMEDVGHFLQLEQPQRFNTQLQLTLDTLTGQG